MTFDPLTWMTGFGLTRIANRIFSRTLKKELFKEIRDWSHERLDADALVPEALLPDLDDSEQSSSPCITALYEKLSEPGCPSLEQWSAALAERHSRVALINPDPQPFFLTPPEASRPLLDELASRLHRVCVQDDRIFKIYVVEMQQRILTMLEASQKATEKAIPASHTPMHQAVLQSLAKGLRGNGVQSLTEYMDEKRSTAGTIVFAWRLGTQSPDMMLLDRVGGMQVNRISIILQADSSVRVRTYDSAGIEHNLYSRSFAPGNQLICFIRWQEGEIELFINGERFGKTRFKMFEYLGPLVLFGIDIDGRLSADAVRWSVDEDQPGLCFRKDNIWHGSVWQQAILWDRALDDEDCEILLRDPLAMHRLQDGSLDVAERHPGQIEVILQAEARNLTTLSKLTEAEINLTVNDRHRGVLLEGTPFSIGAVHWFRDTIVLVIGHVSGHRVEGEKTKIQQVTCTLPLRLATHIPGGRIDQWMPYLQILQVVAESFGLPLACSSNGPTRKFHIESDWDGTIEIKDVDHSGDVCVLGVFSQETKKCHYVWAFSVNHYRTWLSKN